MLVILSDGTVQTSWDVDNQRINEQQHKEVPMSRTEAKVFQARLQQELDEDK